MQTVDRCGGVGMNEEEQKCKDAGYIEHNIDAAKDMEGTLKINDMEFKVTVLRMTRYMPPPLRVAKDCFKIYKPGNIFASISIDSGELK